VPKNAKCISQPPLHYREGTNIFAPWYNMHRSRFYRNEAYR
jgi:hypothetical protein